jgi:phospholipase/carboxylesterase
MVMAIHGLGDRPDSFAEVLADLDAPSRLIVPRGLTAFHDGFSWFPLRGALDDAETSRGIVAAADKLAAALAELSRKRPTRGRPIVTGFSQGGALSFALAVLHPDAVAAAYPVGGWVSFPVSSEIGRGGAAPPPIVALHGAADARVPVGPTRDAVAKLKSYGLPVELREFPGVGHSIPEPVRRELHGLVAAAVSRR